MKKIADSKNICCFCVHDFVWFSSKEIKKKMLKSICPHWVNVGESHSKFQCIVFNEINERFFFGFSSLKINTKLEPIFPTNRVVLLEPL